SQSSLIAGFGLGQAAQGTLDVLWPGGTRNRLYDVQNGERVVVPEIPCSITGQWKNFGEYNSCVHRAINDLRQAHVVTEEQGARGAQRALRASPAPHAQGNAGADGAAPAATCSRPAAQPRGGPFSWARKGFA